MTTFDAGKADMLAGRFEFDGPFEEGGRWGLSAILRPTVSLERMSGELAELVGPGQWVHGPLALHFTVRTLEPYENEPDPRRAAGYVEALRKAAAGLPPVRIRLMGVNPHSRGVAVYGEAVDDTAKTLRARLSEELSARDAVVWDDSSRDTWYMNLMHFTRPPKDPEALVAWCAAQRALGVCETADPEIVRWRLTDTGIEAVTLS
jgi:hypothetical protein